MAATAARTTQKEIKKLEEKILVAETNHQASIIQLNAHVEKMQLQVDNHDPQIKAAQAAAAATASAAAAVKHDDEIKKAKSRIKYLEETLENQERLVKEGEEKLKRECDSAVQDIQQQLTSEAQYRQILVVECEGYKKRLQAKEATTPQEVVEERKAWEKT